MEDTVNKLNNNKTPGEDGIPAELLKHDREEFLRSLYIILTAWVEDRILEQKTKSIIHPIHKKGDLQECSKYQDISLLRCTYKVLSNVLYKKLLQFAERSIGKYQAGFGIERYTADDNIRSQVDS